MVRGIVAAALLMIASVPALAQDDFPRVEMSMGLSNMGFAFPGLTQTSPAGVAETERKWGFTTQQGFNFTNWIGFENSFAAYSMGQDVSLISNTFGAKLAFRRGGPVTPFGVAGIGGGYLTNDRSGYGYSGFNTRIGAGFEWGASDGIRLRVDLTRLGSKFADVSNGSVSFTAGIAFTLMN